MGGRLILNQAIADGLDIIGDRWTILILRSAFFGVTRFDGFQRAIGASRSTLARRLNALVDRDIFFKRAYGAAANRVDYLFTKKGLGLLGSSLLAAKWESDWRTSGYVDLTGHLFHSGCGSNMQPKAVCRACKEELVFKDVGWPHFSEQLDTQLEAIRTYNTQHRKRAPADKGVDPSNYNLASLIGDRWTLLVLITSFFGAHRYDAFASALSIPPSVLSERLRQLVANRIFERVKYQDNPPRYDYRLTDKGQALFPFVMSLRQWVEGNLEKPQKGSPLTHLTCTKPLLIDVVCDQCDRVPLAAELEFLEQ